MCHIMEIILHPLNCSDLGNNECVNDDRCKNLLLMFFYFVRKFSEIGTEGFCKITGVIITYHICNL